MVSPHASAVPYANGRAQMQTRGLGVGADKRRLAG